jgi:hypothetical protein
MIELVLHRSAAQRRELNTHQIPPTQPSIWVILWSYMSVRRGQSIDRKRPKNRFEAKKRITPTRTLITKRAFAISCLGAHLHDP